MIDLFTDMLATHRLSRLVARDTITAPLRDFLIREAYALRGDSLARSIDPPTNLDWTQRALDDGPDAPKAATLIVCSWCNSWWLALIVVAARRLAPKAWAPVAAALAASSVAGLLSVAEHFAEPQEIKVEPA